MERWPGIQCPYTQTQVRQWLCPLYQSRCRLNNLFFYRIELIRNSKSFKVSWMLLYPLSLWKLEMFALAVNKTWKREKIISGWDSINVCSLEDWKNSCLACTGSYKWWCVKICSQANRLYSGHASWIMSANQYLQITQTYTAL